MALGKFTGLDRSLMTKSFSQRRIKRRAFSACYYSAVWFKIAKGIKGHCKCPTEAMLGQHLLLCAVFKLESLTCKVVKTHS